MSSTSSHPRKGNPATKAKMKEGCPVCKESPTESKRKGQHEAMLSCLTCGETYHAFRCLKLKHARLEIIEKKGWYCEGHKKCEKCRLKSSTNKNKLLFCDICDVAWHLGCLPQQYDKIPEGVWACPDCLKRNPNVLKEQQRLNKLRKRVQDAEDGEESPSSKRRKVAHRKIDTVKRTKAELEQETKPFFDLYYANKDGPRTLLLADLSRTLSSLDSECLTYIKTTIGGDTYADIGRASETAFLPEDRGLFEKFTEVNNDKDKCEQNNAAWYEDLRALVSRMSTPMQEYIKFKVGDVIWSRLILLSLPRSQNRSVNGFEVDGVNVSEWDLVPKSASPPCTQCSESGFKCEYVREMTDKPGCRECAFGDRTKQCDVKPVYQTTTARYTRGSTLVPVNSLSSVQAQSSPKNKRKRKAKPPQPESGPLDESISQVATGSRNATELPSYTITSAHGLSTPHRRHSSASPMGARERYSVSPLRARSAAPPSFLPVSPQREKIVDHDTMTTPGQNSEWPISHLPPSPQLSVSRTILPMIQPSPQQPLFPPFSATLGLDRPFQLGLFSLPLQPLSLPSRPAQSEFFSRHASPPPPPTRQISPPPPPTRQVSVPRQPLTPPASHSSAEDMDHNSGSVVSSSSHVDPYLEREVVRKDREIARKDAELAELRMRLQQAEAQSPGPRDTDLLAKEKILNQRLLQVDAREQALENKIKRSEEEAARLEAEKRDFERNRQSWAQEKDAQKEVVKNLIGQLAHAQSQML